MKKNPEIFVFPLFYLITIVLYFPCLPALPIWDDNIFLFHSEAILKATNPFVYWPYGEYQRSWPVYYSFLWGLYRVFKEWFIGYRLFNIILHSLNSYLLYKILKRFNFTPKQAIFASLLFLVHPLNVESVAWIIQSKTLLSLTFLLLAAIEFHNFIRHSSPRTSLVHYCSSSLLFLFSLLSKSTSASCGLFLLLFLRFGRKETWSRSLKMSSFFILFSFISFLMTIRPMVVIGEKNFFQSLAHRIGNIQAPVESANAAKEQEQVQEQAPAANGNAPVNTPEQVHPLWNKAVIYMKSHLFYLQKFILPLQLLLINPQFELGFSWPILLGLALFFLAIFAILYYLNRKKHHTAFWAALFFLILIFPLSGVFNLPFHHLSYVADHWAYVPMIGLVIMVVKVFYSLPFPSRPIKAKTLLTSMVAVYFSLFTFKHVRNFADEEKLFLQGLSRYNNQEHYLEQIGIYYFNQSQFYKRQNDNLKAQEKRSQFRKIVEIYNQNQASLSN